MFTKASVSLFSTELSVSPPMNDLQSEELGCLLACPSVQSGFPTEVRKEVTPGIVVSSVYARISHVIIERPASCPNAYAEKKGPNTMKLSISDNLVPRIHIK